MRKYAAGQTRTSWKLHLNTRFAYGKAPWACFSWHDRSGEENQEGVPQIMSTVLENHGFAGAPKLGSGKPTGGRCAMDGPTGRREHSQASLLQRPDLFPWPNEVVRSVGRASATASARIPGQASPTGSSTGRTEQDEERDLTNKQSQTRYNSAGKA